MRRAGACRESSRRIVHISRLNVGNSATRRRISRFFTFVSIASADGRPESDSFDSDCHLPNSAGRREQPSVVGGPG
jgi:hypothetical protein